MAVEPGILGMTTLLGAMITPAMLYAGLGAASIPIIIHLLSRRRFRIVRWAAVDFLREADRRNRRRVRMEELILLALRCLAMLLIGLMLSRWFIRPDGLMAIVGAPARTERIVVIDDAFSMGVRADDQTVFDRARGAVDRLVGWLQAEAPGDPFTVLLTSRPDHPLRSEPSVGTMAPGAWREELEALQPGHRTGTMPAALASVRQILDERGDAVNATVYIVSDFREVDWPADIAESGVSPAGVLAGWAGETRSLRVVLIDVGGETSANVSVIGIEPDQPQVVRGVNARYGVRVRNFGQSESQPTTMHVYVGDAAGPPVPVPPIPPRQTINVPIEVAFPNEGADALTIELDPDALPVDDVRHRAVPVARALRILVVNGEPHADAYQDEVFLLTVALRPEGMQFSGNEVVVVDENEFEATDLDAFHAVILANVYQVNEDTATRLERYTAGGGGVAFFLGDQVDPEVYNRILFRDGQGLLPARLVAPVAVQADHPGVPIGEVSAAHPAMRRFQGSEVSYFEGVMTWRFIGAEVPSREGPDGLLDGPESGMGEGMPAPGDGDPPDRAYPWGTDLARGNGTGQVLLSFGDADRHPALVAGSYGDGRVVLMTTSVDKEWTSLPEHPVYVVLMMELVQYIARPVGDLGNQLVGEPIRFELDPGRHQLSTTLRTPRYPEEAPIRIEAQPDPETGVPVIHWADTDSPGVYAFDLAEMAGTGSGRLFAVNVDTRGSDLRRASREVLLSAFRGIPTEHVPGDRLAGDEGVETRRELWPAVWVLLVAVLMVEHALACWFGSGRRPGLLAWLPGRPGMEGRTT